MPLEWIEIDLFPLCKGPTGGKNGLWATKKAAGGEKAKCKASERKEDKFQA